MEFHCLVGFPLFHFFIASNRDWITLCIHQSDKWQDLKGGDAYNENEFHQVNFNSKRKNETYSLPAMLKKRERGHIKSEPMASDHFSISIADLIYERTVL